MWASDPFMKICALIWTKKIVCITVCELNVWGGGSGGGIKCINVRVSSLFTRLALQSTTSAGKISVNIGEWLSGERHLVENQFGLQTIPEQSAKTSPYLLFNFCDSFLTGWSKFGIWWRL